MDRVKIGVNEIRVFSDLGGVEIGNQGGAAFIRWEELPAVLDRLTELLRERKAGISH